MFDHVRWTESLDALKRVTWDFWLYNRDLVLDAYIVEVRQTTRHGYKVEASYHRLSHPGNRDESGKPIAEADVPLTQDIIETAIARYTSQLHVRRWSEVQR